MISKPAYKCDIMKLRNLPTFPGSIHYQNFGKRYHLSWLSVGVETKWTWVEARNYCRRFCMDAVSFDTRAEYDAIADIIEDGTKTI